MSAVLLLLGCGDNSSVRFCTGGATFCAAFGNTNRSPVADAGADQDAASDELVRLDGSASRDPDGRIESYSWAQTGGIPVALVNADRAVATFIAPDVADAEVLRFQLTVVDNDRRSDSDDTSVTVQPPPMPALAAGLQLLEKRLYPQMLDGEPRCAVPVAVASDASPFLGFWLTARIMDVGQRRDDTATNELLDELRRIFPPAMARMDPPSESVPDAAWAATVLRFGVVRTLEFVASRDAQLEGTLSALLADLPAGDETIFDSLERGDFVLRREPTGGLSFDIGTTHRFVQENRRRLLDARCDAGVDAHLIAAATVLLACRVSPDGC